MIVKAFFTITLFLLIFTTCGLPSDVPYLEPIQVISSPISSEIAFRHSTSNDREIFIGYELYYKLYNKDVTDKEVKKEIDYLTTTDIPNLVYLQDHNFLKVAIADNIDLDNIRESTDQIGRAYKSEAYTIEINPETYEIDKHKMVISLKRANNRIAIWKKVLLRIRKYAATDKNKYDYFNEYTSEDFDVKRMISDKKIDSLSVLFVAIPKGFNLTQDGALFYGLPRPTSYHLLGLQQ